MPPLARSCKHPPPPQINGTPLTCRQNVDWGPPQRQHLGAVDAESHNLSNPASFRIIDYTASIPGFRKKLEKLGDLRETFVAEAKVHKDNINKYMEDFKVDFKGKDPLKCVLDYLETQGNSASMLTSLLQVAIICGYSTSTVENVFSARARIDTSCRRRLTPYKQGVLTLLHFEKDLTSNLKFDDFVVEWKKLSDRRLRI